MGRYIETDGPLNKAKYICEHHEGEIVDPIECFDDVPEGKALIIVVENGPFDAAAFVHSEGEFNAFTDPHDGRRSTHILMDWDKTDSLAGH